MKFDEIPYNNSLDIPENVCYICKQAADEHFPK